MAVKERCLRCDESWSRTSPTPTASCRRCGDANWATEFELGQLVGIGMEYEVYEETVSPSLVLTLGLMWTENHRNNARVPLCHRLKSTYRHAKSDLGVKDGRELVVWFDRPISGPQAGFWQINIKRRPRWLDDRDSRRIEAATARALLDEIGEISAALNERYQSDIVAVPNYWNSIPPITVGTYDELRGLGRIVQLGPATSSLVNRAYGYVAEINRAIESVNRILVERRQTAMRSPKLTLQSAWLAAHRPKTDFLGLLPQLEKHLKSIAGAAG